jgi:magnesium transporter
MILFFPMVLAVGGNAGSQSATLIIRTMALGELRPRQALHIARRELCLASLLGLGVAAVSFCSALIFVDLRRACVVAGTVILATIFGAVTGAMLPLAFKRMGMDPALMSNPLIASIVDVMGVVIYYSVALLLLG